MPTLSHSQIPKPKSWDEFEDICRSSFQIRWASPNLQRHGRAGQRQNGVDIYGEDDLERFVGIQCKLVEELVEQDIDKEIMNAKSFTPSISAFYFATSLDRDRNLQAIIRKKSSLRVAKREFPLGIVFWDEIISELIKNELEFNKHYPQISLKKTVGVKPQGSRPLASIDLGYHGPNLKHYMQLLFGELGQMTGEDPLQIEYVCRIIEQTALLLLDSATIDVLSSKIREFLEYVLPWVIHGTDRPQGWRPANDLATQIENTIQTVEYNLRSNELRVFELGKMLAAWNRFDDYNDTKYPRDRQRKLMRISWVCFHNPRLNRDIRLLLKRYNEGDSVSIIHTPFNIYQLLRKYIIERGI